MQIILCTSVTMSPIYKPTPRHSLKCNHWNSQKFKEALEIESEIIDIDDSQVSIDSRTINNGDIFVALKGENTNGNLYALKAIANGAAICIVDEMLPGFKDYPMQIILVDDALLALNKLAEYVRTNTNAKIIAVTGSVGKTSTKEMLKCAFNELGKVYASIGNFNNHFGLPLCLANMPNDIDYGVFEIGMNHAGEIRHLSAIAKPDVSIITNIEAVHLEFFNDVANIAEAKAEIFESMAQGCYAVVNYDNSYYKFLYHKAIEAKLKTISFGSDEHADFAMTHYRVLKQTSAISAKAFENDIDYSVGAVGIHHALNSLAVLAAVHCLNGDLKKASRGLARFTAQKGRGAIIYNSGLNITIIDDSYNASPASVEASLKTLSTFKIDDNRLVVILGDMKELGDASIQMHTDLLPIITSNHISKVFCVGSMMKHLYDALPLNSKGVSTEDANDMAYEIKKHIKSGDVVLIKGSRSMKMEYIVSALVE